MRVFVSPVSGEMGKFQGVIEAFPWIWEGIILDVGCRTSNFKRALLYNNIKIRYYGVDICPPADVIINLENGLPFASQAYDVVIALDILEHINNLHKAFDEICRCARRFVIITLPNAYELKSRIKFLIGRSLSGKYGLPLEPPEDRHRWLFSLKEARSFVQARSQKCGFKIVKEGCLIGPRRSAFGIGWLLCRFVPNLLAPWYIVMLERRKGVL
ncbi:MAG: methyltransferase domain-containing protein [Anaerolineae bacterium]|nr:methyltransferase domain-containing protein [Anaerolineae bacterium]